MFLLALFWYTKPVIRGEGPLVSSQVQTHDDSNENKENEFIDFMVSAGVAGGLLFGIFIVATIIKLMM